MHLTADWLLYRADDQELGQEVEGGTSWEGERNSGKKRKALYPGAMRGLKGIASHVARWS